MRLVLGVKDWLAARLSRASWSDEPVRRFLRQYYEAKDIIGTHRSSWYWMVGLQYVAFACDCTAVYMACLSLGLAPKPWIIVMGFVFAMAGLSVITAPGGGGSFEVILSAFLSRHGLSPGEAIAVAVLYRVVAFWIPVLVSVVLLYRKQRARLRRQR
jgi:uncharacterized protein (TIRG00374 family)